MKKTATEAELRARVKRGETVAQIADQLDVVPSTIYCAFRVLGIESPRAHALPPPYVEKLLAKLRNGESLTKAARSVKVPYITAYQYLRRAGLIEKRPAITVKDVA